MSAYLQVVCGLPMPAELATGARDTYEVIPR